MKVNIFSRSVFIIFGFIFCISIANLINPNIFTNFFSTNPTKLFYDIEHYSNLAINQSCSAFYPLWPWLISNITRIKTINEAALYFRVFGSLLTFVSIPMLLNLLTQNLRSYKIAILVTALYAINPLSVFRMIGYTEGIFSVLSLIFLLTLADLKIFVNDNSRLIYKLFILFLSSLLLSLTRPFLIQALIASVLALVSILIINKISFRNNDLNSLKTFKLHGTATVVIALGALSGYCIYGYYCLSSRGDFFAPFHDQKLWGKELGLYPQLFFIPLTYADFISIYFPAIATVIAWLIFISTNIRKLTFVIPKFWQWILLIGYPPAFLAFYGFDFSKINFSNKPSSSKEISITQSAHNMYGSYMFWFCLYFVLIHSIIIVFSDQKLTSLRRFIFGTPYFFVVIAYISQCFPTRKVSKILLLALGLSSIWLVQYWLDYSNNIWIG